jgi:hypothetical protein
LTGTGLTFFAAHEFDADRRARPGHADALRRRLFLAFRGTLFGSASTSGSQ